jgi:serine/threonine protein kinase
VDSRAGTTFGKYRIIRLLGKGTMGEVYEAYDTAKDRTVALKILTEDCSNDVRFRTRFQRESRAAATLQEPHIIPIHDSGEMDGNLFLDMRLVQGQTLYDLLRKGPLGPERAVAIIQQIAAAVDAAHAEGLIHRDIKPQNIIVTPTDFAYLLDFGTAEATGEIRLTMAGAQIGSFAYMAPERFSDQDATPAVDVYALACVLHESLTGEIPFPASSLEQVITAHIASSPPRPSVASPRVPAAFDDVIARGMAKQPDDRYGSAGALGRAALRALDAGDLSAAAPTMLPTSSGSPATYQTGPQPAAYQPPSAVGSQPPHQRSVGQDRRARRESIAEAAGVIVAAPVAVVAAPVVATARMFQRLARRRGERASGTPTLASNGSGDRVTSSVFVPPGVERGNMFLVQIFAHLAEQASQAETLAQQFDEDAQRRGFAELDPSVREGEQLGFELLLPGLLVDTPLQRMVWTGRPQSVQFGVSVPPDFPTRTVIGTVTISRDSVPIGHVKFKVSVCAAEAMPGAERNAARYDMHRYSRAFISYASADRDEVLKRTQMLARAHIEFFQDLLSLDPGQRWERELFREIDRCDVFYLFWSSAAKKSEWVLKEVDYAMARNGGDEQKPPEILPVVIEGPPPVEPPSELAHLHFNDRMIYFMQTTPAKGFPRLWRRPKGGR